MKQILRNAQGNIWVNGPATPAVVYGIRANVLKNVPDSMPEAAAYPTPGPTDPAQNFLES